MLRVIKRPAATRDFHRKKRIPTSFDLMKNWYCCTLENIILKILKIAEKLIHLSLRYSYCCLYLHNQVAITRYDYLAYS